jgi:glutathione S-transferase
MTTPILCELDDPGLPGFETFSPFCMKVHRALRLLGVPYERRHGAHPGVHRAHNPTGQVPVLLVGSEALADSTVILRWLEAKYGGLVPADPHLAAEAWLWEELADTSLNGYFVAARWADPESWPLVREAYFRGMPAPIRWILPGRLRAGVLANLRARDVLRRSFDDCVTRHAALLDDLEARAPQHGFWLGESPSVADLALFAQLHGLRAPLTPRQAALLAARPRLTQWLDRVEHATRATRENKPRQKPQARAIASAMPPPVTASAASRSVARSFTSSGA